MKNYAYNTNNCRIYYSNGCLSLAVTTAERITLDHVWTVRMKHWCLSPSRIHIRSLYITISFCDFLRILEKSFSPHVDIFIIFEKKITNLKRSLHYIFMLHTWSFSRLDHSDYITTLSVPLTHFRNQILSQRVVITLPSSMLKKTKNKKNKKKRGGRQIPSCRNLRRVTGSIIELNFPTFWSPGVWYSFI